MARSSLTLALGGMIAMAAAMGIGRFLYTPALPMMVEGTSLDPAGAGLLASANFAGYLAGALAASVPAAGRGGRVTMLIALALSALTTALMASTTGFALWVLLRFAGGVASAFVLVLSSSLVVARLRAEGRPELTALHFGGVGAGIALSAVMPLLLGPEDWAALWMAGGWLTAMAVIAAALLIPAGRAPMHTSAQPATREGLWRLVLAYGALGFGYVITATFIVAILREGGESSTAESIVWLLVGLAAAPSVWVWGKIAARVGMVRAYQVAMSVEAAGVALSALSSGVFALAVAAIALGGTFMGLTAMGLQEAARRAGGDGRAIMGLMTAAFGVGQMTGPAVAGWLREATGSYALPSMIAAALLIAGAVLVQPLIRR